MIKAFEKVLHFLSYAYYVKGNGLIDDHSFDVLEKIYSQLSKKSLACRGKEKEDFYSSEICEVYDKLDKI